jgi:heparan-alpha-glucosaminide N-acetyltransferase
MNLTLSSTSRLASIDIFRAVTMLAMIFVNDFWTLQNIPRWLEHTAASEDGMGLSDVVFPAFLFIVGLSIPLAIDGRRAKGEGWVPIQTHILERTFALLVMGIFIVNYESMLEKGGLVSRYLWEIAMILAFFLIWNKYPDRPEKNIKYVGLKLTGYAVLILLAFVYRGDDSQDPSGMETRWWGILGLIGWTYLICATVYLLAGDRWQLIIAAWLFFLLFNLAEFAHAFESLAEVRRYIWIVGSGAMPAFTMAGIAVTVLLRKLGSQWPVKRILGLLIVIGVVCCVYGFAVRPYWGISKIHATPAWVGICTAISLLCFTGFYWLTDIRKAQDWALTLKPAGTATLTCYLVPYFVYAVSAILGFSLPLCLRSGGMGLSKSFIFALLVVIATGQINKKGIILKI